MGLTTYFSLLFLVLNLYPSDKIALLLGERGCVNHCRLVRVKNLPFLPFLLLDQFLKSTIIELRLCTIRKLMYFAGVSIIFTLPLFYFIESK